MPSIDIFSGSGSAACGNRGYFLVRVEHTGNPRPHNYTFQVVGVHCMGSHVVPFSGIPDEIAAMSFGDGEILKVCCVKSE